MNDENTEKLFKRFKFFRPERSLQEGLMAFGFDCGDGWFQIVWDLCVRLENSLAVYLPASTYARGVPFEVMQVKEKYGGLRFYTNWESDDMTAAISGAEERSVKTCELCGQPGERRGDGWIVTRCPPCYDKEVSR